MTGAANPRPRPPLKPHVRDGRASPSGTTTEGRPEKAKLDAGVTTPTIERRSRLRFFVLANGPAGQEQ